MTMTFADHCPVVTLVTDHSFRSNAPYPPTTPTVQNYLFGKAVTSQTLVGVHMHNFLYSSVTCVILNDYLLKCSTSGRDNLHISFRCYFMVKISVLIVFKNFYPYK